jgi:hypothetical protein
MCLLTFFPNGQQPDEDALYNGAMFNGDGHGFAIVSGSELIVHHGMHEVEVIEAFMKARHDNPDGPALFHSRFTTHGETNEENCHPFYVGADRRTVLAHNGVLPMNVQPNRGDHRSDTRIAAEGFIPSLGSLRHRRTRLAVEKWMGKANKIAILSVNPKYREQAYLLNEAAGTWDGGTWYSNDGYLPYRGYFGGKPKNHITLNLAECGVCEAVLDLDQEAFCPYCQSCVECWDVADDCLCYRPMALTRPKSEAVSTAAGNGWPSEIGWPLD